MTEDKLVQLDRDYVRSVQHSDVRWSWIAPAFLRRSPRPAGVSGLGCEDVRIRKIGEVAIIHARTTYLKPDGQPGRGRYTDTWAKRDGRWLCVAAHVTRA